MAFKVTADTSSFGKFATDLRRSVLVADAASRVATRAGAQSILKDAQARASFSTRIPGSGHVRVVRGGYEVVFGGSSAPDAAPIENRGKGYVTHPVFGREGTMTNKNSRPPFIQPAIDRFRPTASRVVGGPIVDAVVRSLRD